MKYFTLICAIILTSLSCLAQNSDVTGCWTTVDDETKTPKSVVQIYEYQGKYYGRVIDLFKNKEATANLPNSPKIIGLDIIWDMLPDGKKLKKGKILDPQKGKVYDCEIWREDNNLIVRGKIAFLGRNQTWIPSQNCERIENPIPKIIYLK